MPPNTLEYMNDYYSEYMKEGESHFIPNYQTGILYYITKPQDFLYVIQWEFDPKNPLSINEINIRKPVAEYYIDAKNNIKKLK